LIGGQGEDFCRKSEATRRLTGRPWNENQQRYRK